MKRSITLAAAGAAAIAAALGTAPALADTAQVVTGVVGDSISVSLSRPTVSLGTLGIGANVVDSSVAGTMRVQANTPYVVKVHAAKATMTRYADGAYDDTKALATPLSLTTASTSTGAVPVTSATVGGNSLVPTLVASSAAPSSDHIYDLGFTQAVLPTDPKAALRHDLTYVASAAL